VADAEAIVVVTYDDTRFEDARDVAEYLHTIAVDRGDGVSDVSIEPYCNHDAAAVVGGVCECGAGIDRPGPMFTKEPPNIPAYGTGE
jgi:hypothetical protein